MALQFGSAAGCTVELKGPYGSVSNRVTEITLPADSWKGAVSPYSQTVEPAGITVSSKLDLQPDPGQLETMRIRGMALAAENEGGLVTVYAFGQKPGEDLTLQATITEVQR